MRGLLVALLGALGLGAWWRRRRHQDGAGSQPDGPDPAEELRARLAESRTPGEDAAEQERAEVQEPVAEPEPSPLDPESRRRDVHDRARASMDELG